MKALVLFLPLAICQPDIGSYCAVYTPLELSREAATALVRLDRSAAEAATVNEETWRGCP